MDKNKEVNKRSTSDNKKVGYSKSNILKSSHINIKSGSSKNKISYISRAKNVPIPFEKKYNIYSTDTKSFLKQTCDKCRLGASSHLLVNTSVSSPSQLTKIEAGHDLNGNLPFNPHAPFCNISTVPEIPNFNKVLSYRSDRRYEISVQKPKQKSRAGFHEKRTYNSKVANSNNSLSSNKFFSAVPHSTISYHCTKSAPGNLSNTVPFLKLSTNRICGETTVMREKYNPKCFIKPNEMVNEQLTADIKVTNFPVFAQSSLPSSACFAFQVDYPENQLQDIKKPEYFLQKWEQISVASLFENSKELKDNDKMLFPALPSNVQNQEMKTNSSYPRNNLSFGEHFDLESANSISRGMNNTISIGTTGAPIIPQASYADVIRMSATCSSSLESDKISEPEQNSVVLPEKKDENIQSSSSDWVISRLSQLDQKSQDPVNIAVTPSIQNVQNSGTPNPIIVSLEKPSFYNSKLQNSKSNSSSLTPLSPSERSGKGDDSLNNIYSFENLDKMSSSSSAYSSSIPSDIVANVSDAQAANSKTDSVYSSASSVSSSNNAFKPVEKRALNKKVFQNKGPPVIIMNNCSPPDGLSDISFGIEYEEMVKLCFDNCDVTENVSSVLHNNDEQCLSKKDVPTANAKSPEVLADENSIHDSKSHNAESVKKSLLFKQKEIFFKESAVNYNQNNHEQLTKYFASLWKECERDSSSGSSRQSDKIQIYQDS